jgi:hypothetical protein
MKMVNAGSALSVIRRREGFVLLFILVLMLSCIQASTAAKRARRIRFKTGATAARVSGSLKGIGDEALFVLRARSGQHMKVNISGAGPTRGTVIFPSGKQDGQPGGMIFDDELTETGDYRIRVTESNMGEAWRGSFVLEVEIR